MPATWINTHYTTILLIVLFAIKLRAQKKTRDVELKYFWTTLLCCLLLILEDILESYAATDPSMRFWRTLFSVIGYVLRPVAAVGLLLAVSPPEKRNWKIWIPALFNLAVNLTAFFSPAAFSFDADYDFVRGPLGYVVFVVSLLYMIWILRLVLRRFYEGKKAERWILIGCVIGCMTASSLATAKNTGDKWDNFKSYKTVPYQRMGFPTIDAIGKEFCILSDVSELYATELGDDLVAGVTDDIVYGNVIFSLYTNLVLGVKSRDYFNAGILVMNLEAMRREDVEGRLTALMKRRRLPVAQDQDYLNIVCRGRARLLDHSWNQTAFPDLPGDEVPNIVHFKMYYKPWHYTGIAFEDRFWKYMLRTSYYSEVRSMLDRYTQSQREEDEVRSESLLELACNEVDDWTVEEDGTLSDSLFEIYGEETDGRAVAEN